MQFYGVPYSQKNLPEREVTKQNQLIMYFRQCYKSFYAIINTRENFFCQQAMVAKISPSKEFQHYGMQSILIVV